MLTRKQILQEEGKFLKQDLNCVVCTFNHPLSILAAPSFFLSLVIAALAAIIRVVIKI